MEVAIDEVVLKAGDIEVRPAEFLACADGQPLNLTARELDLLSALVARAGRIVSREELYGAVWGEPYRKSDRSVDVYIGKLRQKLEQALPAARLIHTHFGFGYRFQQERRPLRDHGPGSSPGAGAKGPSHRFHISETSP